MKTINVPNREDVSESAQRIFDTYIKSMGRVPNLYATIGYSGPALKGILDFERDLSQGTFNAKEREAIYLLVSQLNDCAYCLAAHTLIAAKNGYTHEEILDLRRGIAADPKLQQALTLTKGIVENQGHANDETMTAFFEAGYNEAALMDLIALITIRTFTNYIFAATQIPVDFPAVEKI